MACVVKGAKASCRARLILILILNIAVRAGEGEGIAARGGDGPGKLEVGSARMVQVFIYIFRYFFKIYNFLFFWSIPAILS